MNDSAYRIEFAIRTRQLAKAALDLSDSSASVCGMQLAEMMQQIKEIAALVKKEGAK